MQLRAAIAAAGAGSGAVCRAAARQVRTLGFLACAARVAAACRSVSLAPSDRDSRRAGRSAYCCERMHVRRCGMNL